MARVTSLNFRDSFNRGEIDVVPIVLVRVVYRDQVALLSTDPTVRMSTDPLIYGTWHKGFAYNFALMSAITPDDKDNAPIGTSISMENVSRDQASLIRAMTEPATVDMFVVLHTTPDVIEAQWLGLKGTRGAYDQDSVSLDISREHFVNEPWPSERMTKSRFPGLFK